MLAELSIFSFLKLRKPNDSDYSFQSGIDLICSLASFFIPDFREYMCLKFREYPAISIILYDIESRWRQSRCNDCVKDKTDMNIQKFSQHQLNTAKSITTAIFNSAALTSAQKADFAAHVCLLMVSGKPQCPIDRESDVTALSEHIRALELQNDIDEFNHLKARQQFRMFLKHSPVTLWKDRSRGPAHLRDLTAPAFVKSLYSSLFINGILDKQSVREFDPDLLSAIEEFIFNNRDRFQNHPADSMGIRFYVPSARYGLHLTPHHL